MRGELLVFCCFFMILLPAFAIAESCHELAFTREETFLPSGYYSLCPGKSYNVTGIRIDYNLTTLDCQGSTLLGRGGVGIFIMNASNVTIKNCRIRNYDAGVVLRLPGRIEFRDVILEKNIFGVSIFVYTNSSNLSIYWDVHFNDNMHSYTLNYIDVRPPNGTVQVRNINFMKGTEASQISQFGRSKPKNETVASDTVGRPPEEVNDSSDYVQSLFIVVGLMILLSIIYIYWRQTRYVRFL